MIAQRVSIPKEFIIVCILAVSCVKPAACSPDTDVTVNSRRISEAVAVYTIDGLQSTNITVLDTEKGLEIYYGDPKKDHVEDLSADVGVILKPEDFPRIARLKRKFKVKKIAKTRAIVGEFPFKNQISIIIGIRKGFPALNAYKKANKIRTGPPMVIYDVPNKKMVFAAKILK